jgi:hypothetical protein
VTEAEVGNKGAELVVSERGAQNGTLTHPSGLAGRAMSHIAMIMLTFPLHFLFLICARSHLPKLYASVRTEQQSISLPFIHS